MKAVVRLAPGVAEECELDRLDDVSGVPGLGRFFSALVAPPAPTTTCPACGWTKAELIKTSYLGCGLCYSVFADTLALIQNKPTV